MSIEEMELFEAECKLLCYKGNMSRSNLGSFYNNEQTNWMYQMWLSSKNRDGYKLVPTGDTNIADTIWGKCPCGSSMSPIISNKVGYNLIHCFACGANKYIHKDY